MSTFLGDPELATELSDVELADQYRVILMNDDFTPMEFVIETLQKIFKFDYSKAMSIMLLAHHQGQASCGAYAINIARAKVAQVVELATQAGHPLQCYVEIA